MDPVDTDKWCLRDANWNNYMTAVQGGAGTRLTTQTFCGDFEKFTLILREDVDYVAIDYNINQA